MYIPWLARLPLNHTFNGPLTTVDRDRLDYSITAAVCSDPAGGIDLAL